MVEGVNCELCLQVEEGWWSGLLNGKFGLFPSNFVKEMEESDEADAPDNGTTEPGTDALS